MFVTSAFGQETALPGPEGTDAHGDGTHAGTEVPAGGAHGESGGFPPFDSSTFSSQIFWIVLTFGLFYWFMKRVITPRIGAMLDTRRERIAGDIDQASRAKAEADAAVAAYEQELAEARGNATAIGQKARDEAKAEAEAARKAVEASLDAKLEESERRIAAIKASAMNDVGAIAEETAAAIVEQLSGRPARAEVAAAVKAAAN